MAVALRVPSQPEVELMSLKKFFAEELREFRWVVIGSLVYWFVLKPTRAALTSGGGELGIASWYGPGYIGNKTANGETFTAKEMTAAHKTLPFNTRVRVTDVDTGRSVVVRINDRGPYVKGRITASSSASTTAVLT
jgi:rare lipoprotein A (peptidoglycan hydrolase)